MLLVLSGGLVVGGVVIPADPGPPQPAYGSLSPSDPVRLEVPRLKVRAPIVPIQVTNAVLDPPADVLDVGWWAASAKPGSGEGSTVIAGHTVHTGGGSLDDLPEVKRNDVIDVVTERGTMRYAVMRRKIYDKEALAREAAGVFGQDHGNGRLVLISCTDWDGAAYESNVVVYAAPLGKVRGSGDSHDGRTRGDSVRAAS
ncbi:class F sortase [Nocardioides sp. CBS4Y-1]|uniref:Class F sortase n=2 Tax=Nocardioides acrostichi TaxID=2784339 RepID=A0A930YCG9_9ACTN|nr:class F sortase [Nocardioides acrostichi]